MGCALTGSALWRDTAGPFPPPRPELPGPADYDVAVVGAGFTGLWTAYHLVRSDPTLRVCVLEAEVAGFGASGRNGGWCSALFPTPWRRLVERGGEDGARRMQRAMFANVADIGRTLREEGIDAGFHRGGTLTLARSRPQWQRLREEVATARGRGYAEEDLHLLGADEVRDAVVASRVLGASFTPHCAVVHPLRLVHGLAQVVTEAGVDLFEHTPVQRISPGRAETRHGVVRAEVVVRATEGWTARLPGLRRAVAPVYSLMVATEPLPDEVWDRVGLADRPTFTDARHVIVYGQRTADGRLAFGGRGAPYHLGSRIHPDHDSDPQVFAMLRQTLLDLLPGLGGDVRFSHAWGGPLGIARDWAASVGLDRRTGLAWAGGYVGDGVATSHLAGRALADLVLGRESDLVTLPWVGHHSPPWEPEPLRWLGINAGLRAMALADREEATTGRPSRVARVLAPFIRG